MKKNLRKLIAAIMSVTVVFGSMMIYATDMATDTATSAEVFDAAEELAAESSEASDSAAVYSVSDADGLREIAEMINDGKNADATVVLENDITVDGSWTPLGKNAMFPFRGSFDGNGHSVTVTVDNPDLMYFGFFGCLEDASVKNLTVNGEIYCSEPYAYVGGISARARGNVTLENCVNNAAVSTLARGCAGVGGLIGGYDDNIEYRFENIRLVMSGCTNNGIITVTGNDTRVYAGGIVGSNQNCVQLTECANNGAIYAPGVWVGGLLGQAGATTGDFSPSITDCSSDGTLVGADGKTNRLYGKGTISTANISGSGDNVYSGENTFDGSLLDELKKYSASLAVPSNAAVGDYVRLLRDGETAAEDVEVVCSQGEKDISKGYITCDEHGIRVAQLNTTGRAVSETATVKLTGADGSVLRKPVAINIYPNETAGAASARTELMNGIAQSYAGRSSEWVVFDMAVYEKMGFGKNTTDTENYLNYTVNSLAGNTPLAIDRAKAEIILSALDTDTTCLTPFGGETAYSNAAKLEEMYLGSSYYSAPWILLAEEAGQVRLSDAQRNAMISQLIAAQGENGLFFSIWGTEKYDDVDTTGTALAAVARFYDENAEVRTFADKAIEGLSAAQGENGSFGNINSDAMVITGLAAMGISPASDPRFVKSGGSLADAVMLYANDSGNGFETTYVSGNKGEKARALATEQGFRALIVLRQLESCTAFNVYTQKAIGGSAVTVDKKLTRFDASGEGKADALDEVTSDGTSGSQDDGKDDSKTDGKTDGKLTAALTVTADGEEWLSDSVTLDEGATVAELIKTALEKAGMKADGIESGYIRSVTKDGKALGQFDGGELSGWMFEVNGAAPDRGIADYVLKSGDKVRLYFTSDYTQESGSKKWSSGGKGSAAAGGSAALPGTVTEISDAVGNAATGAANGAGFADVAADSWYADAVRYAVENKLMNGVSETEFAPEERLTRAMLVTMLHRIEGTPSVNYALSFRDINDGEWYTEAVRWAASEKIVLGLSEDMFGAEEPVTREQAAAIFMRYAAYKGYDTSAANGTDISTFDDFGNISEYAVSAVRYAVGSGLMKGETEKLFYPFNTATRAEMATVIMRFMKK